MVTDHCSEDVAEMCIGTNDAGQREDVKKKRGMLNENGACDECNESEDDKGGKTSND